ncbi:carboxymuconolactone decarboxylase family protein [Ruegeria arenilitoris]|uniref:carboxymuconolactone decarboxylase family protein n=1 Tax=Ruegeria arenilitoris TaxID=1173585 RepID=UPI00148050E8|nr:carboxymuconolactone decarboxylase family protein [Ruegeria arenilitoris]
MDWHDFMSETEANIDKLNREIPQTFKGFGIMGQAAKADGALSEKTKEFIALGIAIATRCDSCIGFHVRSLVRLNATREEFCEALAMATYMGGGPSYAFSAKALKAYDLYAAEAKDA